MNITETLQKNVVPWINPEQFCKVYRHLFSHSLNDKRWAVDEISVWETRCRPSLPKAVESTVCLVRASIQDMLFEAEKTFCQEGDIQMLYVAAIIRFTALTLEHHQACLGKKSMTALAYELDIPLWIIDMRNEATHSLCPSLPLLRKAAKNALQYLEITYWRPAVSQMQSVVNIPSSDDDEILNLISHYKNLMFEKFETEGELREDLLTDIHTVKKKIKIWTKFANSKDTLVEVLVRPGVFIYSGDIWRLLHISDAVFLEDENNLYLPNKLEDFWLPVLKIVHGYDLMSKFVEKLLISQEQTKIPICHKVAVTWAMQIFLGPAGYSSLGEHFKKKGIKFNMNQLVYACMKGANRYSFHLLQMIATKVGRMEQYAELFCILALYQGMLVKKREESQESDPPCPKTYKDVKKEITFTIGDLEEDLKEQKVKRRRLQQDAWSIAPASINFEDIALGAVLHPTGVEDPELSADESINEVIRIEPGPEDTFIIVNKKDKETLEEMDTSDKKVFRVSTLPEQFDMVYRRRTKQ